MPLPLIPLLLRDKESCEHCKKTFRAFILENANTVDDCRVLWSAIKDFIRNTIISFASHPNRTELSKINKLENDLQKLGHE